MRFIAGVVLYFEFLIVENKNMRGLTFVDIFAERHAKSGSRPYT